MTRLQLRSLIRKRLGETTAAFWQDDEINSWINDGCNDIAFRAKCLKGSGYLTTTASTGEYAWSTNFTTAYAPLEVYHKLTGATWVKLDPITITELDITNDGWRNAPAATPNRYYFDREKNIIGIYPSPIATEAGTNYLRVDFSAKHVSLADDNLSPDLPEPLHLAICDFVVAMGNEQRGWGDKANDAWLKYYSRIRDYQVERHRELEDEEIIMKNYRNV